MGNHVVTIFTAVMPVLAILSAGYFLRQKDVVDAAVQHSLMRLTLWVFFPALVLDRIPHNTALNSGSLAWATPLAGFLTIAVGLALAWLLAPLFGAKEIVPRRTFTYSTAIYNYGYIAIPLCQSLIGRDAVAVLLLFNAGCEVGIWTIGLVALTGQFSRQAWKQLLNPMTLSSFFALGLNRTGAADWMPEWLNATFAMLGACAIPVGILLVGMALPALLPGFSWRSHFSSSLGSCVLRNGLIPLVMIIPVLCLAFPHPLGPILALQAAMPAGFFPIVVAQHFGGDPRLALRVTIASSLCALATLPLWLGLLSPLITATPRP